jgi:hypothetical protein
MKPKVYIETTIVGYLASGASRNLLTAAHQKLTKQWWSERRQAFDLYCSELVVREAAAGDPAEVKKRLALLASLNVLELSEAAAIVTKSLLKRKAFPPKAQDDATHVAIATVNGMDYLITWNCAHLANAALRSLIEKVCKKAGYRCPIICSGPIDGRPSMTDEVLTEIRRIKEEFAAKFNHDVDAMFRFLKQCERESGRQYVNLTKKPKKRPVRTRSI